MNDFLLLLIAVYFVFIVLIVKPVLGQVRIPKVQHLVFGTASSIAVLWWFRTGIYQGLDVHFLWLTALTLTLGWRWAIVSSAIALLVIVAMGVIPWEQFGLYGLIGSVIPILFSHTAYVLAFHKLPRHFFVYVFFCSFFVGMCSIALKMALFGFYYSFFEIYTNQVVADNYLILIPLLLFPEGLLNGMTMTLLVIYKPDWVATFYDSQYLDGK